MHYFAAPGLSGVPVSGLGNLPERDIMDNTAYSQLFLEGVDAASGTHRFTRTFLRLADASREQMDGNMLAILRRHPGLGWKNVSRIVWGNYLLHSPAVVRRLREPRAGADASILHDLLLTLSQTARALW